MDQHFPRLNPVRFQTGLTVILLLILLVSFWGLQPINQVTAASAGCSDSTGPNGAYVVTVCVTNPVAGTALVGAVPVTISISVSGSNPGIQRIQYTLNTSYLLTAFASPYSFSLPTTQWVDGSYTLGAAAVMRDGFTGTPANVLINFQNGITKPPVNNNQFTPTSGTTPAPGSPFVVAAAGDGASGETNTTRATDLISSWNPNLFLYLGDVYEKGSPTEFANWYGNSTSWYGKFKSITDPAIGNHEYSYNSTASGYFNYWDNIPNYYSYNAGGWHFIALNSTSQFNQTSPGTAQYSWLSQDLSANANKCTIVYFHHPVYSVGPQGSTTYLSSIWSLLTQSGVSIVLSGHDHDYQRWAPLDANGQVSSTGTTQFVVGTGGHGIQAFTTTDSRMIFGADTSPGAIGALRLELSSNQAVFKFTNYTGTILDQGTIPCSKTSTDTSAPSIPGNLTASAASATKVNLAWSASNDNIGVAGYTIYRNNSPLASVGSGVLSYSDTTAAGSTTYNYNVDAFDAAGNHSGLSNTATVTTPAAPVILTFSPDADAYVSSTNQTKNYGKVTSLRADSSPILRTYMRFTVSGTTGKTIQQILLHLYASSSSTIGVTAYPVGDNTWGEYTINYQNAPVIGTAIASSGPVTTSSWKDIDLTPYIVGDGTYSLALTTTDTNSVNFNSREASSNQPQLLVSLAQSTPTPTATSVAPTPTNTPLPAPTATNTPVPPATATDTPIPLATATNTPIPVATSTDTPVPPAPTPTPTGTPAAIASPTPTPTNTPTPSASITLNPSADSYVSSGSPTSNYGTSTSLRVDASPDVRSYLRFDVQNWSGPVTKVTLLVYANTGSTSQVSAYSVLDNTWGEKTITYNNAPAFANLLANTPGSVTSGTWLSFDVTAFVTGNGSFSFGLLTPGSTQINLASRENTVTPPQLVIQ